MRRSNPQEPGERLRLDDCLREPEGGELFAVAEGGVAIGDARVSE